MGEATEARQEASATVQDRARDAGGSNSEGGHGGEVGFGLSSAWTWGEEGGGDSEAWVPGKTLSLQGWGTDPGTTDQEDMMASPLSLTPKVEGMPQTPHFKQRPWLPPKNQLFSYNMTLGFTSHHVTRPSADLMICLFWCF